MRIRISAFLLAIIMLCTLLPLPAAAADSFTVSKECVDLIKSFEGFSKYPYYDNGQYTVGYGTACPSADYDRYRTYGITEQEAVDLLMDHLDTVETRVNRFVESNDLSLQQHQFDALVSFSYNVGYTWMYERTGLMYQAVISDMTGNDFLFAITLWSRSGENTVLGLVNRRLVEANLYLNGEYSNDVPSRYGYVLFDHIDATYEGVSRTIRVQGYDADLTDHVRSVAVSGSKQFSGWYSSASGGRKITQLDHSTKGLRLYPRWNSSSENTAPESNTVIARGKVTVRSGGLNIRSGTGTQYSYVGSLKNGTPVDIYQITTVGNTRWGRIDKGWICLTYVQLSSEGNGQSGGSSESGTPTAPSKPDTETASLSGTVQLRSGTLNIRSGPGTKHASVGYLRSGTPVTIMETTTVGSVRWGRIDKGWICLSYVQLSSEDNTQSGSSGSENKDTVLYTGRVTLSNGVLNIRSGAGTSYPRVGCLTNGSNVSIYEVTTANGARWGRTDRGWISMHYITIN